MTYPNPPQYPPQQPMVYPATQQGSSVNPVLVGIVAGLGIIIVGLAVVLTVMFLGKDKPEANTKAAQPQGQPTSTVMVSPAPTVTVQQQPGQTVTGGQARNIPWPPSGATATCGSTIAVNSVTSCEFAENVADAYWSNGTGTVYAYRPVTNIEYKMYCQLSQASVVVCTGGKNAVVYIQQ